MTRLQTPLPVSRGTPPEFYCAEVWGGNRPMDGPIRLPGARGWVFSQPSEGGRGGDIHYVSLCNSGLISRMCLADVAGHGEPVARVSSEIHALLGKHMNTLDQRKVLAKLNQRLEGLNPSTMTTAAAITYFPPARAMSVSYAGHPPGWFYSQAAGHWQRMVIESREHAAGRFRDLPLATAAETTFSRHKQRVAVGDQALLVTDGVLEAPGPGGELFGEARLEQVLEEHRAAGTKELARAIVAALVAFTGDPRLAHDDVTLLVLEIVPGPKALGLFHGLRRRLLPRPAGLARSD